MKVKAAVRSLARSPLALLLPITLGIGRLPAAPNTVLGEYHELNDNGAWSWFMDERVIVDRDYLIVSSVRANGTFRDRDKPGWGNVELAVFNLKTHEKRVVLLHEHLEQDDHDNPGLLVLPDGRYLATYSLHNVEPRFYCRLSTHPHNPFEWDPIREFVSPGQKGKWGGDNFTYGNPMRLSSEPRRVYLFHRGVGQDPNYLFSDDNGLSWSYGGRLYIGLDGYSPYTKYACDGKDTIHFVATEDHPRNFDNSLYHGFIRDRTVFQSEGTRIAALATSTNTPIRPQHLSRIFQGGPTNVAWMTDLHLDPAGNPVVLFTVQVDGAGLRPRHGGMDHRFHYARWDGQHWQQQEIAFAGTRLYPGEDDYTGLGAIDPQNTEIVFISTDAHPTTGEPLVSTGDQRRHREIFRGRTNDGGRTWTWTPVTANSTMDNLRPLIPIWNNPTTPLVWMRGTYRNNHGEWTTKVVMTLLRALDFPP